MGQSSRSNKNMVFFCLVSDGTEVRSRSPRSRSKVEVVGQGHQCQRSRYEKELKYQGQGHYQEVKGQGYEGQGESRSKLLGRVFSSINSREVRHVGVFIQAIKSQKMPYFFKLIVHGKCLSFLFDLLVAGSGEVDYFLAYLTTNYNDGTRDIEFDGRSYQQLNYPLSRSVISYVNSIFTFREYSRRFCN